MKICFREILKCPPPLKVLNFLSTIEWGCRNIVFDDRGCGKLKRLTITDLTLHRFDTDLKGTFNQEPTGGEALIGNEFKLQCTPPDGVPQPQGLWDVTAKNIPNTKLIL